MEPVPEAGWESLAADLVSLPGTVIILGGVGSGKSTLVRYLAGKLVYRFGGSITAETHWR